MNKLVAITVALFLLTGATPIKSMDVPEKQVSKNYPTLKLCADKFVRIFVTRNCPECERIMEWFHDRRVLVEAIDIHGIRASSMMQLMGISHYMRQAPLVIVNWNNEMVHYEKHQPEEFSKIFCME